MPYTAPAVSIITPAYNTAGFLSASVESALAQTFSDFELIIVDDGSTDGTLDLARDWERRDRRVRVFTQSNGGSSRARNAAMGEARGAWFALLDSDDVWVPRFLERQLAVLEDHPDVDVVTGNAYNLNGPHDGLPLKPMEAACRRLPLLEILENEDAVCIMSVFRRALYDRLGGFNPTLKYCEDYEYWVRAAHAGFTFLFNPEPLALYRRRLGSKTFDSAHLDGVVLVYKHARLICADRPAAVRAIDRQIARFERERLLADAKTHLLRGNLEAASEAFARLSPADGLTARLLASVGRRAPRALRWAYRAKTRLRALRRAEALS